MQHRGNQQKKVQTEAVQKPAMFVLTTPDFLVGFFLGFKTVVSKLIMPQITVPRN